MTGIATAIIGGAAIGGQANKDAAKTAANARPKFARILEPGIERQMEATKDTNVPSFQGDRIGAGDP